MVLGLRTLSDSSANNAMTHRLGVGRVRHLEVKVLWLQQMVYKGLLTMTWQAGKDNNSDLGTKVLTKQRLQELVASCGLRMSEEKVNLVRAQGGPTITAAQAGHLLSAVTLLTQLAGVTGDDRSDEGGGTYDMVYFLIGAAYLLGVLSAWIWSWYRSKKTVSFDELLRASDRGDGEGFLRWLLAKNFKALWPQKPGLPPAFSRRRPHFVISSAIAMPRLRSGDPVIMDPRDAMEVSKCLVKMEPPKGIPTTAETWRPLWKNSSNPYQFDRQYLQTIEIARLRMMEKQQDRRFTDSSLVFQGSCLVENSVGTEENFPCRYGDEVVSESSCFILLEGLGSGAFGQVVRCAAAPKTTAAHAACDGWRRVRRVRRATPVALKILKHKDFCAEVSLEAEEEAKILRELQKERQHPHIVQMLDFFEFRGHLCIALELLGRNLYELITEHNGLLSIQLVQEATRQVLLALEYLTLGIPVSNWLEENVLMVDSAWPSNGKAHFKVIDFGGARREGCPMEDLVLQTLPYRAPEVLLGLPPKCVADMWSLGCICIESWRNSIPPPGYSDSWRPETELFVGESLFSHSGDKDEILEGMVQLCGKIPAWMLKQGTRTNEFFDRVKQRPAARTKPRAQGLLQRLFGWAWALRDAAATGSPEGAEGDADAREVYKFRRRSVGGTAPQTATLFGAFRRRRYDLVQGRFGAPQRLAGSRLGQQQRLRRNMEKLIRRMLVLDPERRSDASELKRLTGPSGNLAVGFTHTADLFNPFDGNRYHSPLARSASSPAMATFNRHTNPMSNTTMQLTGGHGFQKSCFEQGKLPLRGTHLPGYQGYVPGFATQNLSLGKCFSTATTALGRFRDGVQDVPKPMPFVVS
eukprot:s1809_g8.t1